MRFTLPGLAFLLCACSGSGGEAPIETVLRVKTTAHLPFGDDDPVRMKGKPPRALPVHGIDLSRHNKAVDFRRAKRAGIGFAFIKATEGRDDRDRNFQRYSRAASRAGMPWGGYHFYYFCAPAAAQARNFIEAVPKGGGKLPPVLDVEWNPKSPTCRKRPAPKVVVRQLKAFLNAVERHYGQKPIIYTTVDFHRENLANGELPGYQYWLRSVTAEPKFKYPGRPWTFWQYTGTGRVPGIEGPVDINAYRGSRAEWRAWLAKNRK